MSQTPFLAAVATWDFGQIAIDRASSALCGGLDSLDCVQEGIQAVELDTRGQYFVGYGGLPNSKGIMELDAAIMDHYSRYGAVMALTDIRTPIAVARTVLERSPHNVLVAEGALEWALAQGFHKEETLTEGSRKEWEEWVATQVDNSPSSHDTIGLICLDKDDKLCAGTSTSGWKFKHPGRVGDSPLVGSGLYCDGTVGAAVATGDGEEIMRCCLSFLVVEYMRQGDSVGQACSKGIQRLLQLRRLHTFPTRPAASVSSTDKTGQCTDSVPSLVVGVVAMDKHGNMGGASTISELNKHGGKSFFHISCWRGEAPAASADGTTTATAPAGEGGSGGPGGEGAGQEGRGAGMRGMFVLQASVEGAESTI